MWIYEDQPSGSNYKNLRLGAVNFNSFGLSISLFILFDLF